ncbi:MAG: HNHc protein [Ignavibacteria bacterium]|nr:HNHc protein [Ignavibacteria bacterium]
MNAPEIVDIIRENVSEKLGREAIVRKVNNRDDYFILDLAFSYFQKADRNKRNDYRSGYLYYQRKDKKYLLFVIAHCPIMITFFSNNFDYEKFRSIVVDTSKYRDEHFIRYAKSALKKEVIKTDVINYFLSKIDNLEKGDFKKQVFTKSTTKDAKTGNIFVLGLANRFENKDIGEIIGKTWDLFMWLYPTKPIFSRNASLNRSLIKIDRKCEINKIDNLPDDIIKKSCSGEIEGAHILPHKDGGSDKLENGVWLCNLHHRMIEGKLTGQRDKVKINVKYYSKKNEVIIQSH